MNVFLLRFAGTFAIFEKNGQKMKDNIKAREVWVDWMRVIACFMVMVVHSTEPFYLGGEGSQILTRTDMFWASFFDTLVRSCVPLFVIASSYLQFPIHYPTSTFFKRRLVRVLIPFVVWTVAYALVWGEPVENFKALLLNFNYAAGHLWFVYMLLGLYVIMPLLSPWAEKVGRKELLFYMLLCFLTTFIPFIREAASGTQTVIYGPGGLPRQAEFPLWGEASWNAYGIFYYLSGFLGYLLLGLYLRKFGGRWSAGKTFAVAVPTYLAGFAICFLGFVKRVLADGGGEFPVTGDVALAVGWETPWYNDSVGVALMAVALVLMLRRINCSGKFYSKVLVPVSKASYGMYLCHMFILAAFSGLWRKLFGIAGDGVLGVWTDPVEILLTALCTFVCAAAVCVLGQKIPKAGKYIFG